MPKKSARNIDGFMPRRTDYSNNSLRSSGLGLRRSGEVENGLTPPDSSDPEVQRVQIQPEQGGLTQSDVSAALNQIDSEGEADGNKRRRRKRGPLTKKKFIKRILISIGIVLLLIGGYVGIRALIAGLNIFDGGILGFIQSQPLEEDANGRTNILVFGTSEDDPGHEAAYLTDSLIVVSIDQDTKDAQMFNIPRDLQVEYGAACPEGYAGKINSLYGCFYKDGTDEPAGARALMDKVGEVTGLDMQYYAHVNYSVVRDSVAAVGGVTIEIEGSDGAPGIMDANFDWKCGASYSERIQKCPPNGHFIEYPNGPANLDAEHALYLMQARGANGNTYGLANSNFDREKNQQKVIVALRDKALSAGTLANFGKVSALIDAVGDNLRTNFQTKEMSTLVGLARDIPTDGITSIRLFDDKDTTTPLDADGNPKLGDLQYADLQAYIKRKLSSDPMIREEPVVAVYNAGAPAGSAQSSADQLTEQGFTVSVVSNLDSTVAGAYELYDLTDGNKNASKTALEAKYGPTSGAAPPVTITGVDFIVIVGVQAAITAQ